MPESQPCEICEAHPRAYICDTCESRVCEKCRTPKWEGNEKRWICTSACTTCEPKPEREAPND